MNDQNQVCHQRGGNLAAKAGHLRWRRRVGTRYRYVRLRWRLFCAGIDLVGTLLGACFRPLNQVRAWVLRGFRTIWGGRKKPICSQSKRGQHTTAQQKQAGVRRILIIQLDHVGDAVISQVLFPPLRRRYPEAEIHVLASPWNQEIFQMIPQIDRIHVWPRNRFQREGRSGWWGRFCWMGELFGWARRLRRERYELAIDVRGELPHALLMWLAGIPRRVGWSSGGGKFLLTHWPIYRPYRAEVLSRRALLECLGIEPETPARNLWPRLEPPEEARERVACWLAHRHQATASVSPKRISGAIRANLLRSSWDERSLVICHLGAGTEAKHWPVEHWAELTARLVARRFTVILVGGKSDQPKAQQVLQLLPGAEDQVWDASGQLSLRELAALVEHAEVLVGADSGPAHLAAAVGKPVVVLFSGSNRVFQWRPRGARVQVVHHAVACRPCHRPRCPLPDHPCMRQIRPEEVLQALERLLEEKSSKPPTPTEHLFLTKQKRCHEAQKELLLQSSNALA